MANSIALISKYLPILDEVYKLGSKTAILDAPESAVQETANAKIILIAKMALQGMGDYARNTGFVSGDVTLTWQSHTFSQDRGRSFQVDQMDNVETALIAFGRLAGEFIRVKVVPELDAYRFENMWTNAGTTAAADLTAATGVEAIDTAVQVMDDAEVPMEGRILYVSATMYTLIKQSDQFSREFNVKVPGDTIDRNFQSFDDMIVIKVPSARFQTDFDFYDGTTGGQEDGGFVPAVGAKELNFMIVHPSAVLQIVKLAVPRVFDPQTNQSASAWKFDYRTYHDQFILDNKVDGIYAHSKAT